MPLRCYFLLLCYLVSVFPLSFLGVLILLCFCWLGGSIGLAVRRRKLASLTAGFVRRVASLKDCERAGAMDFATTDLPAAVWDADLVILCTPLAQMRPLVERMLPALKPGAIVTDVGSVKTGVVRQVCASFARRARILLAAILWPAQKKPGCLPRTRICSSTPFVW